MDINSKNTINNEKSEEEIREDAKNQALEKLKQGAVIVNIDEIAEAEAHKAADAYMTEDKGKSNVFKRFWKHSFIEGYFRQKEINKVREEIKNTGNIYTGRIKDDNKVAHDNTMQAITDRFSSEYEDTLSSDEEKKILDDKDPESLRVKTDIKNLISEYAQSNLDDEAFQNEKTRILDSLTKKDKFKSSARYADNLFELAKNARIAVEHGAKMEELELDTNIILGKAKSSLNTEAHFNNVDKIVDKLKKTKVGQFISPNALATTIGLAYSLTVVLGKKALRSKAAAFGTFGAAVAVSSALAGMNESQRLAAERAQHAIEMAEGGEFEEGSKRREQMEKFQYNMESAKDLSSNLRDLIYQKDENGKDVLKDIKPEDLEKIFASIANIDARRELNKERKIDLISYSSIGNVEKESTELIILLGKAKKELRKKIESDFKDGIPDGDSVASFDSYLAKQTEYVQSCLLYGQEEEKGIENLDKEFKKYKTKEVAKKIATTAFFGLVIGASVQEGVAFFKDDVQGVFEGTGGHAVTQTPLEHIRGWMSGHPSHIGMENAVESHLNGNNFRLPEGTSIIQNSDGTYDVLRGDQVVSDHIPLHFGANGNLDDASISRLGEDGIVSSTTHTLIDGTKEVQSDASHYINNHSGSTHNVHRIGWYDNDTPKPIFDQNELKLQYGGVGGSGIDTNGNYVLDVSHMTSGGSFHEQFSVDAQDAIKNRAIKIVLSLTQGTQHHVFEVPIDEHGNAIIDPKSEIGKLFFAIKNGHAVFKGRFAEVVQSFGSKGGVEQIKSLATLEGPGHDSITDIIPTHIDTAVTALDLPLDTEPPYFIPLITHSPLESLKNEKQKPNEPSPVRYLYLTGTEEDRKRWEENRSPRLAKNPDAVLSQKEELKWYFDKQLKERGKSYVKELDSFVSKNEVLKNLKPDTKIAVCMPVAGAQEYENIYNTLSLYSKQDQSALDKTVIVMNVNWPDDADMSKVEKTISEIERAKKDFPNLQIASFTKVWPRKWIKEKNNAIYGEVVKYVNDVSLNAINKAQINNDVYLLTNDADAKGMSKHYLSTLINSTNRNKNKDGFLGKIEWSPELYEKYPGYHLSMRMYQYLESSIRYGSTKSKNVASSGANFLVKATTFAAVGGYNANMGAGADTDLGRSIKNARYGGRESLPESKYPINYVNGAWIDTDASRSFSYYKDGLPIVSQWENFDEGGYKPRGDVNLAKNEKEDIEDDFESIIKRSSFQITSLIDGWIGFEKKEEYTRALNLAFPPQKDILGNIINLWKVEKNKNGHHEVIFTDKGREWIKKQLKNYKEKDFANLIYKRGFKSSGKENSVSSKKTTNEAAVESKKTKEIISSSEIKDIIRAKIGNSAKIEKMDLNFTDNSLELIGELDAGILGGKIKIEGLIENSGDTLKVNDNLKVEARGYVKSRIENNISNLAPEMKKYFEDKYNQSIKSINIEKGQVVLNFE